MIKNEHTIVISHFFMSRILIDWLIDWFDETENWSELDYNNVNYQTNICIYWTSAHC